MRRVACVRSLALSYMTIISMVVVGCGPRRAKLDPVDAERASEVLRTALDTWKKGETPAALKSASPPIYVQDMDWEAGRQLTDFEILSEGHRDRANWRSSVKLSFRGAKGVSCQRTVKYIITTSPRITVFREITP